MADHNDWDELAAGYALNALTPDEEATFVAHLETCDRCQSSVDDHAFVAAQLGAIAVPEEPVETPSWASMRGAIITDEPAASEPGAAGDSDVVDLGERRHRYAVSRRVLAVAAAVVVLAGGGIIAWQVTSGGSSNAVPSAASCGSAPGCHAISLDDAAGTQAAALTVKGDRITMVPTNMKPAPAGKEYVLWQLPADGRPVAGQGVHLDRRPGGRDHHDRRPLLRHRVVRGQRGVGRADPDQPDDPLARGGHRDLT